MIETVSVATADLVRDGEYRWTLPARGAMRVPGVVFASERLLPSATGDLSLLQVANVATLPGIVRASFAMPDVHWGYGFPIGGVAATDVERGGVVSPGGVGFDISCGVRLLATPLTGDEARARVPDLLAALSAKVPAGLGRGAIWDVDGTEFAAVLRKGVKAAVAAGYGTAEDLDHCEEGGGLPVADLAGVSERALARGRHELGSLGSGNHFLEVQVVDHVFDRDAAARFGLAEGQVTVMIHTGSRGLGHQVCSDHVREMVRALPLYRIDLPDRQLAAAPVDSEHGRRYLAAMAAAANFARVNRQLICWGVRGAFAEVYGTDRLPLVYDVSHNLARLEKHAVDGTERSLCVHRKGATWSLPPGHADLPPAYRGTGQPVLVPGSMGSASYVLAGAEGNEAFFSTCHGAGRTMSRHAARRQVGGPELVERRRAAGVAVSTRSLRALPEETPEAYKDVDEVVRVCEGAGLSRRVARLKPLAVLKG